MADVLAGYAGLATIAQFRSIDDPEVLGRLDEPHRLELGAAMMSRPAAPLFRARGLPEQVVEHHRHRRAVPGPAFLGVPGFELGGWGILVRDGRVLADTDILPHVHRANFRPDGMPAHWVRALLRPDAEIIECDEPVCVVLNAHLVYGHFLLEMLARLHWAAELASMGQPLRVAVPSDAPAWVQAFVGLYFGPERILAYDAERQRVRAPCFVLPTMMMEFYLLHPLMNTVVARLLERASDTASPLPGATRLYLSRSRHKGWHAVENEAEVEAVMENFGFTVVHPQELALPAQLALLRDAACIVVPYSSAAHGALFAPMGAGVLCFGWMNRCQSGIAALRGQPIGFMPDHDGRVVFPPPNQPPGVYRMRIDLRALARSVAAFLRFAEEAREPRA